MYPSLYVVLCIFYLYELLAVLYCEAFLGKSCCIKLSYIRMKKKNMHHQ